MKIKRFFLALAIFVVLLLITTFVNFRFFKVDVVFYSAILDGFIASAITAIILFRLKYYSVYNHFEKVLIVFIAVLGGYIFAISVPTVIDRSLSFYILEKLNQRGGGIKENAFEDIFVNEYMVEHRLVDVRLTEQLSSGTITINNGCVKLTDKGKKFAAFSRFYRQNLLPKHRLLMGEYTDALTDPFKNGKKVDYKDYECN